ncbi:MAG: D-tyrosyl-tRNA(Tyr) deacylase [Candidatus Marinimicrobia bacterium]|jgi:D-tyrosyl-tRNA(Tyr) deacylase|nr:D-tyrosyl-tRNA(Tyr) deacylase [Candidatus Neomarinimicrobiota bacterium]MBT3631043.1 D-tyrosyl-tRNA(Tyr) deacylase [Candidatus Neomarinimicrobiota bacterium]MBT3825683.1 D-tyrosyl-tRNA(Tyr) deacylase [Candidatus Neomarinimicrobiota bacterium]MBT4130573.1 D-tyrosyl-tRNA(Tyr) deacylase [Candidatus Neomarinimicrobiota bacterium]MBT4296206.1 D-tyrosyl-tRNA(Tyr) deacylase [Candidatus Neomarinimicrobiota bacterium]
MIAVLQRVSRGEVKILGRSRAKIDMGYVILLGVAEDDSQQDADWLAKKIVGLRVFEDDDEKMNLSIKDVDGKALVISQFTLLADMKRGRRPGFTRAAKPEKAIPLYEHFMDQLWHEGIEVEKGEFGADMQVHIMNEGPVTLVLDSTVKYPR